MKGLIELLALIFVTAVITSIVFQCSKNDKCDEQQSDSTIVMVYPDSLIAGENNY